MIRRGSVVSGNFFHAKFYTVDKLVGNSHPTLSFIGLLRVIINKLKPSALQKSVSSIRVGKLVWEFSYHNQTDDSVQKPPVFLWRSPGGGSQIFHSVTPISL